jgi:hypothetical protein
MTTKYKAARLAGQYVRRRDKQGRPYYLDRETGKRVKGEKWTEERLRIRSAVEKRKEEIKEGKKPETKLPVYIPKEKRAEQEKKRLEQEKRKEQLRRWEEESRQKREERRRFLEEERKKKGVKPKKVPAPPAPTEATKRPPGAPKEWEEVPEGYEDIEFFEVDDVRGYTNEE